MKKTLQLILTLSSFVLFTFTSCDNLLSGGSLKEELEKRIQYENAAYCKVEIDANTAITSKIIPTATVYPNTYKPTDFIELTFEPNSEWKFHSWKAEPEESVSFEDKTALSTKATLINDNNGESIVISPKCLQRPEPKISAPNDPVNPKNSSITISFSQALNIPEEFLSDIKVEIGGEDITEYFEAPVLKRDNFDIYFASKTDKFLDFTSGTRSVKVTVPAKFYYKKDGIDVEMSEDKVLEYKINEETSQKADFNFSIKNSGNTTINYVGSKSFNLGESFTVKITSEDPDYLFSGWAITTDSGALPEGYLSIQEDALSKEITIVAWKEVRGVDIYPIYHKLPKYTDFEPKYTSNGVNCDTSIVITFNTKMDHESLSKESGNVRITYADDSSNREFEKYYTYKCTENDQNVTVLTLVPDISIFEEKFKSSQDTTKYALAVDLNATQILDVNKENHLTGADSNGHIKWSYVINSGKEPVKPVLNNISVYKAKRYQDSRQNVVYKDKEVSKTDFAKWEDGDYFGNHVKDIYIEVTGFDLDSGLNRVKVTETLRKTVIGNEVTQSNVKEKFFGSPDSFKALNVKDNEGHDLYKYFFYYDFESSFDDGLVQLDISLEDKAGNLTNPVTYYVLHDTTIAESVVRTHVLDDLFTGRDAVDGIDTFKLDFTQKYYGPSFDPLEIDKSEYFLDKDRTDTNMIDIFFNVRANGKGILKHDTLIIKSVKFGYDLDNLQDAKYLEEYIYEVKRDANKEVILSIDVEDGVGNEIVRIVSVPAIPTVIAVEEASEEEKSEEDYRQKNYAHAYIKYPGVESILKPTGISSTTVCYNSDFEYYKDDERTINGSLSDYDGIAVFDEQIRPIYSYSYDFEKEEFESEPFPNSEPKYFRSFITYDFTGWNLAGPNTAKRLINEYDRDLNANSYIPTKLDVKIAPPVRNEGLINVTASFDESTYEKNPAYVYCVGYRVEGQVSYSYSSSNKFKLVPGYVYEAIPFIKDKDGFYNQNENAEPVIIDLSASKYDNVPPRIAEKEDGRANIQRQPNYVELPMPENAFNDLRRKKDAAGRDTSITSFEYWFIPNGNIDSGMTPRSEEYLYAYNPNPKTIDIDLGNDPDSAPEYFRIPYDGINEYSYTLFVKYYDNSPLENYAIFYTFAKNLILPNEITFDYVPEDGDQEKYTYHEDTFHISTTKDLFAGTDASFNIAPYYFDYNDNEWKSVLRIDDSDADDTLRVCEGINCEVWLGENELSYSELSKDLERKPVIVVYTKDREEYLDFDGKKIGELVYDDDNDYLSRLWEGQMLFTSQKYDRYLKLTTFDSVYGDNNITGYRKAIYVYPDYLKNPEDYQINNANIGEWRNGVGLQIFCDQPTLVHTFWCSKDLSKPGNTEQENIDEWLNHGFEVGVMQIDTNSTYRNIYTKDVPKGAYFVVITHFIDGTTAMTKVIKK